MNTIIIELCPEDRARLDKILAALENRPNCEGCVSSAIKAYDAVKEEAQTPATSAQEPAEAPKEESRPEAPATEETPTAATEQATAEAVTVPLADLQNLVVALARKGLKDKVRDVVNEYGVERVSQIPEDKRAEAVEKLKALEG